MSMRYAGDTLDIHAGGQDLVFPHHENEIAQSEAATGKPFARYWLHNGFLDIEGEKMSKSLGNFLTVKDILAKYDPMAIRVFFLLKHYRSPIDFSEERIREAQAALDRLRNAYRAIMRIIGRFGAAQELSDTSNLPELVAVNHAMDEIIEAMNDDFNTAKAMGHLFEIARMVNSIDESDPHSAAAAQAAKQVFDTIGGDVFGINFEGGAASGGLADDLIALLVDLRAEARKDKNWAMADKIRKGLAELGVELEDRADRTTWKIGG
jgi:cysteinyl-tRNA synthetase